MENKFIIKEAIMFGWEKTKEHFWFFAGLLAIVFGLGYVSDLLDKQMKSEPNSGLFFLSIAIWIVMLIAEIGLIRIALKIHDKKNVDYSDLFSEYKKIFNYFLATVLYIFMVVGGLILLIVPGIILAIKFQFFSYLIVDKDLGPIEALKRSSELTRGQKKDLFFFGLLLLLIIILGALALLVGLFLALPVAMMAMVFVYRKLNPIVSMENIDNANKEQTPKEPEKIEKEENNKLS